MKSIRPPGVAFIMQPMSVTDQPHTPASAAPLWRRAELMLTRVLALAGGPAAIAATRWLSRAMRRAIACRLGMIEYIVRKLLLAETLRLDLQGSVSLQNGATPPAANGARPHREAARAHSDPTLPHTWSVRFALRPPSERPSERSSMRQPLHTARAPRKPDPAWRLARRLEALCRVFEDPLPHARRLARLLVRSARAGADMAFPYLWDCAGADRRDPEDPHLSIDASGFAFTQLGRCDSS